MRLPKFRSRERGMALIFALLALMIISAIGLGMVFMTNTETSINANYKDSQSAFYSMRAGMEEMRDRMRTNSPAPVTLPTGWPGGANSVVYIVNPQSGESFNPWDPAAVDKYGNSVYDNEFCHEYFSPNMPYSAQKPLDVPCVSPYPVSTGYSSTTSYSNATFSGGGKPPSLANSPLNYKWIRLTMKQNATMKNQPSGNNQLVASGFPDSDPVCFNGLGNQEVTLSSLPGYPFTPNTCAGAFTAGNNVQPVYLLTSLAVTPSGSRRIGQYETAAFNVTPPPGTLGLDGPSSTYNNGSSNNFTIDGWDGSSPSNQNCSNMSGCQSNYPPGGCAPTGTEFSAVSVGDTAGQTQAKTAIQGPPDRSSNYIGTGGSPSVIVNPAYAPTGPWGNPALLNNLVTELANSADVVYDNGGAGCGFHNNNLGQTGSVPGACSIGSPTFGRAGAPQITYVNGDINLTGTTSGYGVLVVTGTLTYRGNFTFNGLVLVVGQGYMEAAGGGQGTFYGSVFIANTNSHSSPYGQMGSLGSPTLNWNGGGTNGIYYNSCYANILGNNIHYMVLSSREEMY